MKQVSLEEVVWLPCQSPPSPLTPKRNGKSAPHLGVSPFPNSHQLPVRITDLTRDIKIKLWGKSPLSYQVAGTWKETSFLYTSTFLLDIGFQRSRQLDCIWLHPDPYSITTGNLQNQKSSGKNQDLEFRQMARKSTNLFKDGWRWR